VVFIFNYPPKLFLNRALRAGSFACREPGMFPANEMHPTIALSADKKYKERDRTNGAGVAFTPA